MTDSLSLIRDLEHQQVFNVKKYGAKGDESQSDHTAINAAIAAAAAAGGGIVYFPAGVYRLDASINVTTDGITLLGERSDAWGGTAGAVLKCNANNLLFLYAVGPSYANPAKHLRVRGLTFNGVARGFTGVKSIFLCHFADARISDCTFTNVNGVAINVVSVMNPVIDHCRFSACGAAAIADIEFSISAGPNKNTAGEVCFNLWEVPFAYAVHAGGASFDGAHIHHNWMEGTDGGPTSAYILGDFSYGSIHDNFIIDMHAVATPTGISSLGAGTSVRGNYIIGCAIGIALGSNGFQSAIGNDIISPYNWGFQVSASDCIIADNFIYHPGHDALYGGMYITATRTMVHGNKIIEANTVGVRFNGGNATYCDIRGNHINDNAANLTDGCIYEDGGGPNYNNFENNTLVPKGGGSAIVPTGAATRIRNNRGYNPQGAADLALVGSPWTYTNNDRVPEVVHFYGARGAAGTLTVVKDTVTIQSVGNNLPFNFSVPLEPGEVLLITYTTGAGDSLTTKKDRK